MTKFFCAFIALLLLFATNGIAQTQQFYSFEKSIALPGEGGYDYLFIDQPNNKLYVSHGTAVHVIDLNTEKLVGSIVSMQGNHGTAVATGSGKGFISDGKANAVVVFDIATLKTISIIPLTGKKPDAIIYDQFSNRIFTFNGGSDNSSVIDVNSLKEIGLIALNGAPEYAVADGEGKMYINLEDKNMLKVIDTKLMTAVAAYSLAPCGGPTGMAIDTINKRIFTACRENKGMSVINMATGKIICTVPIGAGVDAVVYDAVTKLVICSNGDGTTTIIRQQTADKYVVVQTLVTQIRAKTLALNTSNHKIYLSVVDFVPGTKTVVAGSFKVLVFKMN